MEFRVLGPLEVLDGDGPVPLGGAKQRALMALLLLHPGEVLSTDQLIEEIWGGDAPATAAKSVQVYVSRLRQRLGPEAIETVGHGYRLRVEPDAVDAVRFARLADRGRALLAEDPRTADELLHEALGLWRGRPLADLAFEPIAADRCRELDEQRVTVLEDRIDADLALGRHVEVVPELRELVRAHPLRERLHGQLMLALYRAGRQAEALAAFQDARRVLVEELGLEPGPGLRELERRILAQDPELGGARPPLPRVPRSSRASLLAAAWCGALALCVLVVLTALRHQRSDRGNRVLLADDAVGALDPRTGAIVSVGRAGPAAAHLASARGTLWIVGDAPGAVGRVDLRTFARRPAAVGGTAATDADAAAGRVWLLDRRRRTVVVADGRSGAVLARGRVDGERSATAGTLAPWRIAAGPHAGWVVDGSRWLRGMTPTGRALRRVDTGVPLSAVAAAGPVVWAASDAESAVLRIDPASGRVTRRAQLGLGYRAPHPTDLAVGFGAVWALCPDAGLLFRIDARSGQLTAKTRVGAARLPERVATGAGRVWVAEADGTLVSVDPASARVVARHPVARSLEDVTVAGGRVWVVTGGAPAPR